MVLGLSPEREERVPQHQDSLSDADDTFGDACAAERALEDQVRKVVDVQGANYDEQHAANEGEEKVLQRTCSGEISFHSFK